MSIAVKWEFPHRDYRIIRTTDMSIIGVRKEVHGATVLSPIIDQYGFPVEHAWIVRDAFDENPIPPPFTWFYTPDDAIAAVEILEVCKTNPSPFRTFTSGFMGMITMRREFWRVLARIETIDQMCVQGDPFGELPDKIREQIKDIFQQTGVKR